MLAKTRELRRKQFSLCSSISFVYTITMNIRSVTTRFNTRRQMMTPLLYCTCVMMPSPISKQMWILCVLHRQCQFNKTDRMHTSTTYFGQFFVFFCLMSEFLLLCEIKYFVTVLSLITLQGRVCTHKSNQIKSNSSLLNTDTRSVLQTV